MNAVLSSIDQGRPAFRGALSREQWNRISNDKWLATLDESLRLALFRYGQIQHAKRGAVLGREGSIPGSAFCLTGGIVKLTASSSSGKQSIVELLEPGEWFGGVSILQKLALPYSAECWTQCTILTIPGCALRHIDSQHPALTAGLLRLAWLRSRKIIARSIRLREGSLHERSVEELQLLFSRFGVSTSEGTCLPFQLTQTDLALLLGASRQRVNELLGRLVADGILARSSSGLMFRHAEIL